MNDESRPNVASCFSLSVEQKQFVEDTEITDGKLYAPPGSGKSLSIIRKHMHMVQHRYIRKHESLIITFTRHSCRDIQDRILQYPNHTQYFEMKSPRDVQHVRTIDALAYQVMKRWNKTKTDMVQILSPWLLQFLQQSTTTESMIRQTPLLRTTRVLFVDEAQDLNRVQYDIVMRLKELLHLTVFLVGDPNQSIYGFRGSSPCYMIDFVGKEYHLSYNFRSTPSIVTFTEYLKPHKQYITRCKDELFPQESSPLPNILHASFDDFGTWLQKFLKEYPDDWSTIAILCPTKGNRLRSDGMVCGLSRVSNLLESLGISFVQSYQETSNHDEATWYETVPGSINLLTFHGSKGKEWKTVICMDVWFELMNRIPTRREHADYQYLLYVAMTRAQRHLIVYMGREKHPNPYLYAIPMALYDGFIYAKHTPQYSINEDDRIYAITDAIDRMSPELLMKLEPHVKYDYQSRSFYNDHRETVRKVVKNDFVLFGVLLENLFSMQCALHKHQPPRSLRIIETLLSGETICLTEHQFAILQPIWKSCSSWAEYDQLKSGLPPWVVLLIHRYFRRTLPWERHFLSCGSLYQLLQTYKPYLTQCYQRYKGFDPNEADEVHETMIHSKEPWEARLQPLFYLTLVTYCYTNNHLFNIKDQGKSKLHLIDGSLMGLFRDMNQYAKLVATKPYEEQISVRVPYLKLFGKLDLKFVDGTIMEFKACQKSLSLPNLIQLMVYTLADSHRYHDFVTRPVVLYNFLTGEVIHLRFTVPESSMVTVFSVLAQSCNQLLQRVKCIVHVESNGGTDSKPDESGNSERRPEELGNQKTTSNIAQMEQRTAPNAPIYLSIKDYKYQYYLVRDQYIQTPLPLPISVTMLTGITDDNLKAGLPLESVRQHLKPFMLQLSPTSVFIGYGDTYRKKQWLQAADLIPEDTDVLDGKTIAEVYGNQIHLTLNKASALFLNQPLSHPVLGVVETTQRILQFLNYN